MITQMYLRGRVDAHQFISSLFSLPGFMLFMVILDLMHIADLGILQYFERDILLELFEQIREGAESKSEAVADIQLFINQSSAALGVQPPISNITYGMIADKN